MTYIKNNPVVKCIEGLLFPICLPGHICIGFHDYVMAFKSVTQCLAFYYVNGNDSDFIEKAVRRMIGDIERKDNLVTEASAISIVVLSNLGDFSMNSFLAGYYLITAQNLWQADDISLIFAAQISEQLGRDTDVMVFCFGNRCC